MPISIILKKKTPLTQEPAARWQSPPFSNPSRDSVPVRTPLTCSDSSSKSCISGKKYIYSSTSNMGTAPSTCSCQLTTLSEAPTLSHLYELTPDHLGRGLWLGYSVRSAQTTHANPSLLTDLKGGFSQLSTPRRSCP